MWNASVIKVGVVDIDIRVSSHLKLAWASDKLSLVISMIKNSKSIKELKGIKQ